MRIQSRVRDAAEESGYIDAE
jgi:hypothetical protein